MAGNRLGPGFKTVVNDVVIDYVAQGMVRMKKKGTLRAEVEIELGSRIGNHAWEEIRCAARKLIAERCKVSRKERICNALQMLQDIIADDAASFRDRIKSQDMINELTGMGAKYTGNTDPVEAAQKLTKALDDIRTAKTAPASDS